jgi:outer membrane immunogenic protein
MNKFFIRLALASVAFVPATSVLAADLDVDPPPPPTTELRSAVYDWSGGYAGVLMGATCVESKLEDVTASNDPAADTSRYENAGCGFKGGVLAGWNHQMDNIVLGVEADWAMSNTIVQNADYQADFRFGMNHEITVRPRAGVAMDDTLLFVTAGLAWMQGDIDGINGSAISNLTGEHWGWVVGAGVEHAVTDQFRLRMDYLYSQYGTGNYVDGCCDVDVEGLGNHEVRLGALWAW